MDPSAMPTTATDAFEQSFSNFVAELAHPTITHGPDRLYNIFTGELEPGDETKKYAIVSYIFDPSKLPEFPRLARRDAVSRNHESRGELAPNEGAFHFGIPVNSPSSATPTSGAPGATDVPDQLSTLNIAEAAEPNQVPGELAVEEELDFWEYVSTDFDAVVELARAEESIEGNWMVEVDEEFEQRASMLAVPKLEVDITEDHRAYCREVCQLVSCEAQRRGLKYIWMDILGIDQEDPLDKASQIPRMTDYFRRAEVCVVVSEMVRRRLSHRLQCLGADVLNAHRNTPWEFASPRKHDDDYRAMQLQRQQAAGLAWAELDNFSPETYEALAGPDWRDVAGYSEEERRYRARWGLVDEVAGWLLGFHETRVWTFQETLLARDVVHVGGHLRINTPAVLVMEEYWSEYEHEEARLFPVEWLPTPYKFERLQYFHSRHLQSLHVRFPLPSHDFLRREHQRHAAPGDAPDDSEWSLNQCLSIVHSQNRAAAFEQDKIYGVLGLFPPQVRFALPARYDVSLSAIFAILTYLRICKGDLYAFFWVEDRSSTHHGITDAPSWIPRRYGQMALLQPKPSQHPLPEKEPLVPAWPKDMIRVDHRRLIMTAPYLEIFECADPGEQVESASLQEGVEDAVTANSPFRMRLRWPENEVGQQELGVNVPPRSPAAFEQKRRNNVLVNSSLGERLANSVFGRPATPSLTYAQDKPHTTEAELMEPASKKVALVDEKGELREVGVWTLEHYDEIRRNRQNIAQAVAARQAVLVNFAYTSEGGCTELWMVLISGDHGQTWRKAGNVMLENKVVKGYQRLGMIMEPWQTANKHAKTFVVV